MSRLQIALLTSVWLAGCAVAPAADSPAPTALPTSASRTAAPATTTPLVAPTIGPTVSPSPAGPELPSGEPTPAYESLPEGELVRTVPPEILTATLLLWPHNAYGGFDEPSFETFELAFQTSDELVLMDGRSGELTARLPVPGSFQVNMILPTPDSVWLTDHDAGQVLRLDRETGEELARIQLPGRAVSLLETDHGIWAGAFHTRPSSVSLIDPETNTLGRQIAMGAFPNYGMGSLWFGRREASDPDLVRRVDPATGEEISSFPLNGAQGCYIGGSFPDAVWSWCFDPGVDIIPTRLDLEAGEVAGLGPRGAGLIGVWADYSWFAAGAEDGQPDRLLRVENATSQVDRAFAFAEQAPALYIVENALWSLDTQAGELRRYSLDEL